MAHKPDVQLFFVTRETTGPFFTEQYTTIETLKEIQSAITRHNTIISIRKVVYTAGEEVDIEELKPAKYKGKPYTYKEKYGV